MADNNIADSGNSAGLYPEGGQCGAESPPKQDAHGV